MDDYSKKMFISFGIALGIILFITIIILPWESELPPNSEQIGGMINAI